MFLPKALEREQWVELAERATKRRERAERPTLLFVDDCLFTREAWGTSYPEADVRTFESPEALLAAADAEPELLPRAQALITDYHFDEASEATGYDLATVVRARCAIPVLLCSNGAPLDKERDGFDGFLDKTPQPWSELQAVIGGHGASSFSR